MTIIVKYSGERSTEFVPYEIDDSDHMPKYSNEDDTVLVFKFQIKGTVMVVPLNFYGTEADAVERILTEFFSICYLIEDIPFMDSLDTAKEILRRIESWLHQQNKESVAYPTPYGRHLHHSMPRVAEIYLMAIKTPWGYERKIKIGNFTVKCHNVHLKDQILKIKLQTDDQPLNHWTGRIMSLTGDGSVPSTKST